MAPEARRQLRLAAAERALRQGDPTRCVVEVEELLDDDPRDTEGLWLLAQSLTALRDAPVAAEAWRALIEAGEDGAWVWAQLAACAFESAQIDQARQAAEQALARDATCGEAWYVRAQIVERSEGADAAWPHFLRAHRLGPLTWPLPLVLSPLDVERIVEQALADVAPEVAALWTEVPLRLQPWPELAVLQDPVPPVSPRVLALYDGPPPPDATSGQRPPGLAIYVGNLAHHDHPDQAAAALADALEQEAADWLPAPEADG
ncbi:MAG: hypothetical protein H6732_00305 [Alphaproteobacteria bacterium]|nr:hypothetical protein [Alphaproteobacteria bacterium]